MSLAPHILILAAGQGKRMRSSLPKVLHPIVFRPMIHYVLDLAEAVPHRSILMVVGHGEAEVRKACASYPELKYCTQKEQKGTAHAVRSAESLLAGQEGRLIILSGDVILFQRETLEGMLAEHDRAQASVTMLTAALDNPTGYGRILRHSHEVVGIREEADCSNEEKLLREVNAGVYCFEIADLFWALSRINDRNRQGEFYLTDAIALLAANGKKARGYLLRDPLEMTGINDRIARSQVERIVQSRINTQLMTEGVTLYAPETTFVDPSSRIEPDVTIEPNCIIIDSVIAKGSHIKQGCYIESSQIGPECSVGPYAHLRPGTRLMKDVKIGNFVELKKSVMGEGSKASHLSYIGDADVGENVNLGCGFITCNYDGTKKHKTIIESGVFVGSDSQTVAPVTIGEGSYIASGSTVTENVPPDSLVISRAKQVTKPGYAKKYRK